MMVNRVSVVYGAGAGMHVWCVSTGTPYPHYTPDFSKIKKTQVTRNILVIIFTH